MLYIVSEMLSCLLLALGLGFLIGWFLKKALEREKENLYIESLKQDIKDKDDEWYRLKAELVKCEKKEKALEMELQKSKDQSILINDLKEEIKRLQNQIDSKNKEIEELKETIKDYEENKKEIEKDNEKIKEYENKIEDLKKDKISLKESLERAEKKLNECKESLFALKMDENKPKKEELKAEIIVTPKKESKSFIKDILEVFKKHFRG